MMFTTRFHPNNLSGRNYLLTKDSTQRKKLKLYIEVEKGGHNDEASYHDLEEDQHDDKASYQYLEEDQHVDKASYQALDED